MGDGGLKDRKCVYEHNNNRMIRKPSRGSKKAVKRPHARKEIAPIKRGSSKKKSKIMTGTYVHLQKSLESYSRYRCEFIYINHMARADAVWVECCLTAANDLLPQSVSM